MPIRVRSRAALSTLSLLLLALSPVWGDGLDDGNASPLIADLIAAAAEAPGEPAAPLWRYRDERLQADVEDAIRDLSLAGAARRHQLALALVDCTDADRPRLAAVNGDDMMYAASLPKIAILLAAFEKAERGELRVEGETETMLNEMIRRSSNEAATRMLHRVGVEEIARVLLSPRYRFYDPDRNGGLWVGKDYGKAGLWMRDPLHNLSHAATPLQVARFYYLLHRGELVSPGASRKMRAILGDTAIDHKFAKGLRSRDPGARLFRKSGTWQTFHSDSALVERDGRAYVAVALANDANGGEWLSKLIVAFDQIIGPGSSAPQLTARVSSPRDAPPRASGESW
jgi:beta-lactamase class A